MTAMVALTAVPAFAVPDADCGNVTGSVEANDQAPGCFDVARETANDASHRNADRGLSTAHMHNTEP